MKKLLVVLLALLMLAGCGAKEAAPSETTTAPESQEVEEEVFALPEARDASKTFVPSKDADPVPCTVDSYASDCSSINKDNLQDYFCLEDVVYIDLRDYADYGKKHLRNFECIPYFAMIFDAEANGTDKPQLYGGSIDAPVATYEESLDIIHEMFPQDKTIFLMCQSGGRVSQCMTLLASLGYDMSKIYNVGGMGQYTSNELVAYTDDVSELALTATYAFEGLTLAK